MLNMTVRDAMLGTCAHPALINASWDARPRKEFTIPPEQELRLPNDMWLSNYTGAYVKVRLTLDEPLKVDLEDRRLAVRDTRDGKLRIGMR